MDQHDLADSEKSTVEQALLGGPFQRMGRFGFCFADERWEWSAEVQQMHGYEPGMVEPTTELVLSHKHPDDYSQVAATIDDILQTHEPFSTRHRIIDTKGQTHHVVVVGDRLLDDAGNVIGTQGFYVDVTPAPQAHQDEVSAAVAEIAENRASIEQTKGMLMMIYDVTAEAAFDLLRWRSQETHVKLRLLAEQVAADFQALSRAHRLPPRSAYDSVLLSAHQRITP